MKGYILMMLTMICQLLQARDIKMNIESYHYIKSTNGETITIVEYQLTNRSDEPYFTWIDFNNHNEKRDKKIHRYFYAPHGDLNLATLMTDNVIRTSREVIIGATFIKRLKPGESFKYIVVNEKDNDDFSKNIIVEKVSYVSKTIGFNVPESFEYDNTELVVF